jgi:peptide subunit release factor 1 (eRF1)
MGNPFQCGIDQKTAFIFTAVEQLFAMVGVDLLICSEDKVAQRSASQLAFEYIQHFCRSKIGFIKPSADCQT